MNQRILQTSVHLLALTAMLLGFGAGCASTSSGGSYTLKLTRNDIGWAMTRYENRVDAGFVTYEQKQQVKAAHDAYQAAFNDALKQAGDDLDTPTPDNVKQLANQLLSILSTLP